MPSSCAQRSGKAREKVWEGQLPGARPREPQLTHAGLSPTTYREWGGTNACSWDSYPWPLHSSFRWGLKGGTSSPEGPPCSSHLKQKHPPLLCFLRKYLFLSLMALNPTGNPFICLTVFYPWGQGPLYLFYSQWLAYSKYSINICWEGGKEGGKWSGKEGPVKYNLRVAFN